MTNIQLISKPLKVKKILKKTRAPFFKDIKADDILEIRTPFTTYSNGAGGRVYVCKVLILNLTKEEAIEKTINQAVSILNNFELEIIND